MKHRRECNKQIDQQDRRIRCDCDDDEYDKDGGDSDQDENVEGYVVYPTDTNATELEEEQEDEEDYVKGGYHPVRLGDSFSNARYTVTKKLGWGHFSTVWLARDLQESRNVALKIVKSEDKYTETALDEIKLLERSIKSNPSSPFRNFMVELYDWFRHSGPNGTHIVMVFEVLGPNLLTLIRKNEHRGLPIAQVKQISKQILMGLNHLHVNCGIIHTDLKPENILLSLDVRLPEKTLSSSPSRKRRRSPSPPPPQEPPFADTNNHTISFDTSSSHNHHDRSICYQEKSENGAAPDSSQTSIEYVSHSNITAATLDSHYNKLASRSPTRSITNTSTTPSSSVLTAPAAPTPSPFIRVKIADLGNACWVDHHYTDDIQTRQYRAPEVILGANYDCSADIWSAGCTVFELLTGDFLFEPRSGKRHSKNDDHLAQMMELIGEFPRHVALSGRYSRDYFNSSGDLRNIRRIKFWKLKDVLREKYGFLDKEAREAADFILPMISVDRRRRATAADMLNHPWLKGIEV